MLEDKARIARQLDQHFRDRETDDDNFVSWTSSLLVALTYIHTAVLKSPKRSLESINMLIADTWAYPKGVFIRDIEVIKAFASYSTSDYDLVSLHGDRHFTRHYAAEYLSQGSLSMLTRPGGRNAHSTIMLPIKPLLKAGLASLRSKYRAIHFGLV